jgi:orotidine 5'-phosphate decarboxylase subfamily 2
LCIGLDIDEDKMPKFLLKKDKPYLFFNKSIIDHTKDIVCAYKLNMAFYEVFGKDGFDLLQKTVQYIPENIFIILDGKRNDIGNSARKYSKAIFERFKADAVTVNPYLGEDSIIPFLEHKDKCSFILCRTSNPSATDFQDLIVSKKPVYQMVASKIKQWNTYNNNCGAVVGATYPDELKIIRNMLGDDIPLLIPGIGKQGGVVEKTIKNGINSSGEMAVINSSRGIIYAGKGKDFAEESRKAAILLRDEINLHR